MSTQDLLQVPQHQQWEYATLTSNRTAGFFGVIGAKQNLIWSSTLEDEDEINFEQSTPNLLSRLGRAGWELVSSTTATNLRQGTTHELVMVFVFKQPVATSEEHSLAQLIDPAALLKRAVRYLQQKNPSMAMKAVERAFSLGPQHRELYFLARGQAYLMLADEAQALQNFGTAIQENQSCGEAYMERANIAFSHKDYENAVMDYNQALHYIHDDYAGPKREVLASMRYNRGVAYSNTGKYKEASKDFKEYLNLVQLDPSKRGEIEGWIKDLERRK